MGHAQTRSRRRTVARVSAAIAAFFATAALANGQSGGGVAPPAPPEAKDVTCVEKCLSLHKVAEGGRIEVTGKDLGFVRTVRFSGGAESRAERPSDTSVLAVVPKGADSGSVSLIDDAGNRTTTPTEIEVAAAAAVQDASSFRLRDATAATPVAFFLGEDTAQLNYLFEAQGPTDIRIDVVHASGGETVATIVQKAQEPFATHSAIWNGKQASGRVAPSGEYRFKVSPLSGGGHSGGAGFFFADHRFPVAGQHTYGDGLGAGRNHTGQDVFAACGKPIYAARAGTIQANAYHGSAGYYLVVDGRETGVDYVYMHMERGGRPKEGQQVKTGEVIGYNSDTGNASGCHLHYEMWSAPGWYEGGKVLDPTPLLKRWDRYS